MKDETLELNKKFQDAFDVHPTGLKIDRRITNKLRELHEMQLEVALFAHQFAADNQKHPLLLECQLVAEEFAEVIEAIAQQNYDHVLHEMADLRYVCDGMANRLGLGDQLVPAVREIHRANMSKLGPNGKPIKNRAGRVVKGPKFRPANIRYGK